MDNNKVHALNNIIYLVYNTADFAELKRSILYSIGTLVPNDCASILMANDPDSESILCDPICWPEKYQAMEERYLLVEPHDYSRWLMRKKSSAVINATSLLPDEEREKTELYRICFAPFGLHYSVDVAIAANGIFLGVLSLYRRKENGDFQEEELLLLQLLSEHLDARFYRTRMGGGHDDTSGEADRKRRLAVRYGLTAREAEVLLLILDGKRNEDITERLCISGNTLRKHLQNLYRKTGVTGRTQLLGLEQRQEEAAKE